MCQQAGNPEISSKMFKDTLCARLISIIFFRVAKGNLRTLVRAVIDEIGQNPQNFHATRYLSEIE